MSLMPATYPNQPSSAPSTILSASELTAFGHFLSDIETDLSLKNNYSNFYALPVPPLIEKRNGFTKRENGNSPSLCGPVNVLPKHLYTGGGRLGEKEDDEKYRKQAKELDNWLASRGNSTNANSQSLQLESETSQSQNKKRRRDSSPIRVPRPLSGSNDMTDNSESSASGGQHLLHASTYPVPPSQHLDLSNQYASSSNNPANFPNSSNTDLSDPSSLKGHQPQPPRSKPPLLSEEQKKANHILSEQKRRLAIKNGYDALCDSVPALRNLQDGGSSSSFKKRKGGDSSRAGPKSEAVVLGKSVDYLRQLLDDRETLKRTLEELKERGRQQGISQEELEGGWYKVWERKSED